MENGVNNPELKKFLEYLKDSQTYSKNTSRKAFSVERFYLDEIATRASSNGNRFNESFLGFWVIGSNKKNFTAKLFVHDNSNASDGIPLKSNMAVPFGMPVSGATISWEAQAGAYIDILFAHNSSISVGSIQQEVTGEFSLTTGSSIEQTIFTVSGARQEIIETDSTRKKATIINNTNDVVLIGTPAILDHVDFYKHNIILGPKSSYKTNNNDALSCKSLGGNVDVTLIEEF